MPFIKIYLLCFIIPVTFLFIGGILLVLFL